MGRGDGGEASLFTSPKAMGEDALKSPIPSKTLLFCLRIAFKCLGRILDYPEQKDALYGLKNEKLKFFEF